MLCSLKKMHKRVHVCGCIGLKFNGCTRIVLDRCIYTCMNLEMVTLFEN